MAGPGNQLIDLSHSDDDEFEQPRRRTYTADREEASVIWVEDELDGCPGCNGRLLDGRCWGCQPAESLAGTPRSPGGYLRTPVRLFSGGSPVQGSDAQPGAGPLLRDRQAPARAGAGHGHAGGQGQGGAALLQVDGSPPDSDLSTPASRPGLDEERGGRVPPDQVAHQAGSQGRGRRAVGRGHGDGGDGWGGAPFEPPAARPGRFRGKDLAVTIPRQDGTRGWTLRDVELAVVARSKHLGLYAITEEQHRDGSTHWHILMRAKLGNTFDLVGNAFTHPRTGTKVFANFADTSKWPIRGWFIYIFKTIVELFHGVTEAETLESQATMGIKWICKGTAPEGWAALTVYHTWKLLSNGVIDIIETSRSSGEALRRVSDYMQLSDAATIRAASNVLAMHRVLGMHEDDDKWDSNYTAPGQPVPISLRFAEILATMREWVDHALDLTRPRVKVLIVVGPSGIGKTSTVFGLVPKGTTYSRENLRVSCFRSSSGIVVFDDLAPFYGGGKTEQEGGPLREPPKAWTQRGKWSYAQKHKNPEMYPCRAVVIICNQEPSWLGLAYWTQNTTTIKLDPNEIPMWMEPGTPEARAWIAENRRQGMAAYQA